MTTQVGQDPTVPTAPDIEAKPAERSSSVLGRVGRAAQHVALLAAVLGLWHLLVVNGVIAEFILPLPLDVLKALRDQVENIVTGGYMLDHLWTTTLSTLVGFVGAAVLGVVIGGLIGEFAHVRRLAYPYVAAFNATPRIAFVPLIVIWFGFGISSKIVIAVSIATFPVLVGTIAGLNNVDRDLIKLMRVGGATRWQMFTKVKLRASLPFIFAGLETASIFTLIGVIVGEFFAGSEGLGYLIVVANETLNLPFSFATVILLAVLGVVFNQLVVLLHRRVVFWRGNV